MTSDEVKQLREAAEYVLATNDEITDDSRAIVASFARSLVGTDGEQPVTEEFLKEHGAKEVYNSEVPDYIFYDEHGGTRMKLYRLGNVFVCNVPEWPDDIYTRYQFRMLAAALGIKRKEKS